MRSREGTDPGALRPYALPMTFAVGPLKPPSAGRVGARCRRWGRWLGIRCRCGGSGFVAGEGGQGEQGGSSRGLLGIVWVEVGVGGGALRGGEGCRCGGCSSVKSWRRLCAVQMR